MRLWAELYIQVLVLWKVGGYGNCVFNPTSFLQMECGSKGLFNFSPSLIRF